ncbi:methylamine utilization protein [Undibacterium sp. TS12]|uniref:methylamine utilization protein n=1 Tax=Undibacterium sp. TS12 TaxID=2908202 RepID=UPI001F4C77DF|nr:methylamine utilization protein [Undibacterium sp. TS12]MCH8617967.1 methylamine utilization protein [Undibacterium sp. TS12]
MRNQVLHFYARALAGFAAILLAPGLAFADTQINVSDNGGQAVQDAVVYLELPAGPQTAKSANAEIQQKDKKFIPFVTVVQTGTSISFPNNDTVRHHAYSFSPAKPFELKLYSGKPAAPVIFDKAGTVIVGCNIHDQMVAYIHIVDTPYFAKTDGRGMAKLPTVPTGKYILKTWHPKLPPNTTIQEQSLQIDGNPATVNVKLNYKAG